MASFRDVDPELMQFMQRFGGPQMGLDQPGGLVTGLAKTKFLGQTGKLGRFLDKIKQLINVEEVEQLPTPFNRPSTFGITTPVYPPGPGWGPPWNSNISIKQGIPPLAAERTPVHEGLHASFFRKEPDYSGFPPEKYWPALVDKIRAQHPEHRARIDEIAGRGGTSPGEMIIDWMTRNILKGKGFQNLGP